MPCNVGKIDIIIRVIVGLVLIVLAALYQSIILGIIGLIPLATGMVRFCPLYSLFNLDTGCRKDK